MDRKKKGKSKGGKLGAIVETKEAEKSKENQRENEELANFSSPLYQEYMTKLMTNRGCLDEVKSRRLSVKEEIEDIESKNPSKNGSPANIRASLRQSPEKSEKVQKSEKVESGSEPASSKENKRATVGNVEKTSELKTSEESSDVGLPNSGEKTGESAKVAEISAKDKTDKKEENPKSNGDKSRSDLPNNVKKVVESGGEGSKNGSPVNFRASLRPPKGQKVIN